MSHNEDLGIAIQAIQTAVRTLVKNLYTQRASKGKFTNIFTGDGLDILEGQKWWDRYNELQEACLLELASILGGLEHQGNTFWSEDEVQNDIFCKSQKGPHNIELQAVSTPRCGT